MIVRVVQPSRKNMIQVISESVNFWQSKMSIKKVQHLETILMVLIHRNIMFQSRISGLVDIYCNKS